MVPRTLIVIAAAVSLLFLSGTAAHAMPRPEPYTDVDSLLFEPDVSVIEGRFIEKGSGSLSISAVLSGPLQVDRTIYIARWADFQMPNAGRPNEALGPRDHLFLFLTHDEPRTNGAKDYGSNSYAIMAEGIRVVVRGRVCSFDNWNYDEQPPHVAIIPGLPTNGLTPSLAELPSVEDFRKDVLARQAKIALWHTRFEAPPSSSDIPWLISLLQDRARDIRPWVVKVGNGNGSWPAPPSLYRFQYDEIGMLAHQRLSAIHDRLKIDVSLPPMTAAQPPAPAAASSGVWPIAYELRAIYALLLALAVPALFLLRALLSARRQRVRLRRGFCPKCGYNLTASPHHCPECGRDTAKGVERGIVARSAARITCVSLLLLCTTLTVLWIRSYHVTVCLTRTTPQQAASFYSTRGTFVAQFDTTEGPQGWSYDRSDPAGFPRTLDECGIPGGQGLFGIEYASSGGVAVPLAWPALLSGGIFALLVWVLRRWRTSAKNA